MTCIASFQRLLPAATPADAVAALTGLAALATSAETTCATVPCCKQPHDLHRLQECIRLLTVVAIQALASNYTLTAKIERIRLLTSVEIQAPTDFVAFASNYTPTAKMALTEAMAAVTGAETASAEAVVDSMGETWAALSQLTTQLLAAGLPIAAALDAVSQAAVLAPVAEKTLTKRGEKPFLLMVFVAVIEASELTSSSAVAVLAVEVALIPSLPIVHAMSVSLAVMMAAFV